MPLEHQNTHLEFELQGIEPLNFLGPERYGKIGSNKPFRIYG